jgi:hypothetical protein
MSSLVTKCLHLFRYPEDGACKCIRKLDSNLDFSPFSVSDFTTLSVSASDCWNLHESPIVRKKHRPVLGPVLVFAWSTNEMYEMPQARYWVSLPVTSFTSFTSVTSAPPVCRIIPRRTSIQIFSRSSNHYARCCLSSRSLEFPIELIQSHCGPGVDSASNRNECQESF